MVINTPFKLKKLCCATMVALFGIGFVTSATAAVFYEADSGNTTINIVGLDKSSLGNAVLLNPSAIGKGNYLFPYAAITFTAVESGQYSFGQTYSPVDTIMILYGGVYNPEAPGAGALVGNDDTPQNKHQEALNDPNLTTSCSSVNYCPQVTWDVEAGITYTLFISVYSSSYSLGLPFTFYSTGNVVFNEYTGRSPIDLNAASYASSGLGITVDPIFVGGTLVMDQPNAIYSDDFTLADIASNTINQYNNVSIFAGILSDATGQNGQITIDSSLGDNDKGAVIFTGMNTYTGATNLKGGTLSVSQDANLGDPSAILNFDGGTLLTTASFDSERDVTLSSTGTLNVAGGTTLNLDGIISGAGAWNKDGAGTVILNADNTYTGTTTITNGAMIVGSATTPTAALSGGGNIDILASGTLGGYGSVTGNITNHGAIEAGVASDNAIANFMIHGNVDNYGTMQLGIGHITGNQMTINGNYTGFNGILGINIAEANNASTITDLLIIKGNANGTTYVNITNRGTYQLEGTKIVDVIGLSSDQAFLQMGRVAAGAYEYDLIKGNPDGSDTESWYLTSYYDESQTIQQLRPESASYVANLAAANTLFNIRLHDRAKESNNIWTRIDYGYNKSRENSGQLSTKSDRSLIQIGANIAEWGSNDHNLLQLGVMAGYGEVNSRSKSLLTGYVSKGKIHGYSLGIYGTWYTNGKDQSGFYVDSWLMWNNMRAKINADDTLSDSYSIKGLTASLEAGYSFNLGSIMSNNYDLWLEPQAQAIWMGAKANGHFIGDGSYINNKKGNVQTRLGFRGYLKNSNDTAAKIQPYLEMNWIHNTKPFNLSINDTRVQQSGSKNIGEIKIGIEANLNSRFSLSANAAYQVGSKSYRDAKFYIGLKYSF